MSKMVGFAVLALPLFFVYGCSDGVKDAPRFRADKTVEEEVITTNFLVTDPGEIDLVEAMGKYRKGYRAALVKLVDYYSKTGNRTNLSRARSELKSYDQMRKYKYVTAAHIGGPELRALDLIVEADDLYAEAENLYKKATALVVIVDDGKMRLALNKCNEIITSYPTSDKIDDAAYMAGRIHEHFKDYIIAAIYFKRTFQWNVATRYPARSKAAYIMDKRLNKKEEALELYKLAYKYEKESYPANAEFAEKRILELTKPEIKIDNDKTAVPGDDDTVDNIE